MRLNQYISHNTNYSRREADTLISQGRVKIEQKIAKLGDNVSDTKIKGKDRFERVFIDGKIIKPKNENIYTAIVYNKPKAEIVSKKDESGRRTIYDGLDSKFKGFVSVGRLDYLSEGALILSDSKIVVSALMQSSLPREYIIKASGKCSEEVIQNMCDAMSSGLSLSDARAGGHAKSDILSMDFAPFVAYEITKRTDKHIRMKVIISQGKNRELRRFFAHFGLEITDLKRVSYGFVSLNNLPTGKWRYFTKDEYKSLHEMMDKISKS